MDAEVVHVCVDKNGVMHFMREAQYNLFWLLKQLGLKTTPITDQLLTMTTTVALAPGHYTISGSAKVNSTGWVTTVSNIQVTAIPKPVPKRDRRPKDKPWWSARGNRKAMREFSARHSRNTGRRF
jgi:hypothetical protein